jgi:hypothetical protein
MSYGVRVEETAVLYEEPVGIAGWRVYWSAIWVGALAALALGLVLGLVGTAIGAHQAGPGHGLTTWKGYTLVALAYSVFSAFLSFVLGGWVAGKIAGFQRSEPSMLHGAIAWLVALPFFLAFGALGALSLYGTWYGGLIGTPGWVVAPNVPLDLEAARAIRNAALAAATALLLGLMGSVIGGWLASGEPMTFGYHRTRQNHARNPMPSAAGR